MSGPPFALQLHRTTVWCGATASLSRVDIPCQCPTRTSSSKWTIFSGRVPVVQSQALLTVQGTMRELACPSERISDTVDRPLSTRYSRDCCVGFSRFLYLQQRHMRGTIFCTGEFANSIRWVNETCVYSMIKFFVLDVLLGQVVAVSTDPAPD